MTHCKTIASPGIGKTVETLTEVMKWAINLEKLQSNGLASGNYGL